MEYNNLSILTSLVATDPLQQSDADACKVDKSPQRDLNELIRATPLTTSPLHQEALLLEELSVHYASSYDFASTSASFRELFDALASPSLLANFFTCIIRCTHRSTTGSCMGGGQVASRAPSVRQVNPSCTPHGIRQYTWGYPLSLFFSSRVQTSQRHQSISPCAGYT